MNEKQIDIQDVLNELKTIIGTQAQEIALLKASIKQAIKEAEASSKVE